MELKFHLICTESILTNIILSNNSLILKRPIQLFGNISYFATRIPVKDSKGKISECWVVTRGDFEALFSETSLPNHKPLSEAPFSFGLSAVPRPGSTLSVEAYQKHVLMKEPVPAPADIFKQA